MELGFGLLLLVLFIFGLVTGMKECEAKKQQPKQGAKITVTVETKPAKPVEDKAVFNEAKNTLKLYGFSVSDAKDMLKKAGPHTDADAWVKSALETIEV